MKKLIISVLLIAALAIAATTSVFAIEGGSDYGGVPITADPIEVDGEMDDVYAEGLMVQSLATDEAGNSASAAFTAYLLWDGVDTIYCYADIIDSTPYDAPKDAAAWNTDSLELFLDYSNKLERSRDQYRVDNKGVGTYYVTETLTNEECLPYGFTGYAASVTDEGYSVEFEIKAYKEAIKADMRIGFHLMLNDMDNSGTRLMIHSDTCNNNPDKFGFFTLSANEVSAPIVEAASESAATVSSAPSTLDIATVAILAAAISGSGLILSKGKKH